MNTCIKCGSGKWQAAINQTGNQFTLPASLSISRERERKSVLKYACLKSRFSYNTISVSLLNSICYLYFYLYNLKKILMYLELTIFFYSKYNQLFQISMDDRRFWVETICNRSR